ncbi:hypothetical protein [Streptomyces iconiensis]|uniref:Uncharacterized protein n=1 Tax=Streptomyces iconiensis TaxID=1384038 RepID=A0ABT7A183_9ACTN|nr:hypothetical protein [Streptomyces iconiensis]MDJ1135093.1 hypothetical protein [Streptomyces iconiensis]
MKPVVLAEGTDAIGRGIGRGIARVRHASQEVAITPGPQAASPAGVRQLPDRDREVLAR